MAMDEGQELYVYRRDIARRLLFYIVPGAFVLIGIPLTILGQFDPHADTAGRIFMGTWAAFAVYAVWRVLFRSVMDFTCVVSGIWIDTPLGRKQFIPWGELRRFRASKGWLLSEGWAVLYTKSNGSYMLTNVPRELIERLAELIDQYANPMLE